MTGAILMASGRVPKTPATVFIRGGLLLGPYGVGVAAQAGNAARAWRARTCS